MFTLLWSLLVLGRLAAIAPEGAGPERWVPLRWSSADPNSLELLADTPFNCLLLDRVDAGLVQAASERRISVLAVGRPGSDWEGLIRSAVQARAAGVVLEGAFSDQVRARAREAAGQAGLMLIELPPRAGLRPDFPSPVVGTTQGLWPGIRVFEDGAVRAAPTGGPWVETNTGFLRFLRAVTDAPIWMANSPPAGAVWPLERYLAAVADAAIAGARWVVALDSDWDRRLHAREAKALAAWARLAAHVRFYEEHPEWRKWKPAGQLALIQDAESGALLSGGVVDMIAVKNVPLRTVPRRRLSLQALEGARMAVNVDPSALSDSDKEILRGFTRAGGTLLSGPPNWKFPMPESDRITLDEKQLEQLNDIWREVNSTVGRRNLGVRLFNVAGMLSNLLAAPDGTLLLHLVNYTSYPAENITVHIVGKHRQVRLLRPESPPRDLTPYEIEEGVGVDLDRVSTCAALLIN